MGLLAGLVSSACGASAPTGPPVALIEYAGTAAERYCGKIFSCCTADEISSNFAFLDEQQCVSGMTGLFDDTVANAQEAIGSMRLSYDSAQAGACMAAIEAMPCDRLLPDLGDLIGCPDAFVGLVPENELCDGDWECGSDYCQGEFGIGEGLCGPFPGEGAACPENRCAEGLYCAYISEGVQTCSQPKPDGAVCRANNECANGQCLGPDGVEGVCGPVELCDGL